MRGKYLSSVAVAGVLMVATPGDGAQAQKQGGILRVYHRDSPASMSIHEEGTNSTEIPMMGVFNNLVVYDQHIAQNSLATIRPELADSWSWSEDGNRLSFKLHPGVKWHDGKPFTAADVRCTWDLLSGRGQERFRANPRRSWWNNVTEIEVNGDLEATFVLKRPQPALLTLIASGYTPVYPCHVSPKDMRLKPVGTGPFKFVEFKPNEHIKVTRNPDYWKPGLPHLDGIEFTIIKDPATAVLAFISNKFDLAGGASRVVVKDVGDLLAFEIAAQLVLDKLDRPSALRPVGRSDREEIGKALAVRRRGNPETWRRAGYLVLRELLVQRLHLRRPVSHYRDGAVPLHALVCLNRLRDLVLVVEFLGLDLVAFDPAFRVDQVVIVMARRAQHHTIDLRRPGAVAHLSDDYLFLLRHSHAGDAEPGRCARADGQQDPR